MKLKTLVLHDFQAHKCQQIDLDPHVTCIVGASDVGKSAVLRALRWACLNDLTGTDFIREGAKETHVQIRTDEGTISRFKGTENRYRIGSKEFKAFGQSVPQDITDLLRLNEINFQSQHDPPFWFGLTPLEVSRQLNSVIDLSVIDSALSYCGTEVRRAQEGVRISEERLTEAESELEELAKQEARVQDFEDLDEKRHAHEEADSSLLALRGLVQKCRDTNSTFKTAQEQATDGASLIALHDEWESAYERQNELHLLLDEIADLAKKKMPPPFQPIVEAKSRWEEADNERQELEDLLGKIVEAQAVPPLPPFDGVEEAHQRLLEASAAKAKLGFLLADLTKANTTVEDLNLTRLEKENAFHSKIRNQRCPLCQNEMN